MGEATGEADVADGLAETDLEGVEAAEGPPGSGSQDATASAVSIATGSTGNLRIR